MSQIENLRIDNPCPFVPTRMNKCGDSFYCKQCSKTIIDFRKMTIEDIKANLNKDTCGIFRMDQLQGQQRMSTSRQVVFYCLTLLSFLGFSVKPLAAQSTTVKIDTVAVDSNSIAQNSVQTDKKDVKDKDGKSKKKRKSLFRRYIYRRMAGCPNF